MLLRIALLLALIMTAGCFNIAETKKFLNENTDSLFYQTKPIFLELYSRQFHSKVYFIVLYNDRLNKFYLRLRWHNYGKGRPYILRNNSLIIKVDETYFALSPNSIPKITNISVEPLGFEEEAIYPIDIAVLSQIAFSKFTEIEVLGRNKKLLGRLTEHKGLSSIRKLLKDIDIDSSQIP